MDSELEVELNQMEVRLADYITFEVNLAIKKEDKKILVVGLVALGGCVLAFTTSKALVKLAQGLAILNQNVETLASTTLVAKPPGPDHYPSRSDIEKMSTPVNANGKIDETLIPPTNDVSEPFDGPASETSEAVRQAIEADPLIPSEVLKEPGV